MKYHDIFSLAYYIFYPCSFLLCYTNHMNSLAMIAYQTKDYPRLPDGSDRLYWPAHLLCFQLRGMLR